jgi:hypothetical protein
MKQLPDLDRFLEQFHAAEQPRQRLPHSARQVLSSSVGNSQLAARISVSRILRLTWCTSAFRPKVPLAGRANT